AEVANGRSVGRVAQFGITAQITNQNDLVERHFRPPLVCVLKGSQESYNERPILLGAVRCVKRATEVFAAFGFDRNDATKSDRLWPVVAGIFMSATVYLETFGCQMNVADSERAAVRLSAAGFSLAKSPE